MAKDQPQQPPSTPTAAAAAAAAPAPAPAPAPTPTPAQATPAQATPAQPTPARKDEDSEEDQPPPPTTPYPGTPAKVPEGGRPSTNDGKSDASVKGADAQKPAVEPVKVPEEALKPPTGTEAGGAGGAASPNAKKGMIGAKGFNLGLAPAEASTEPVVKCKECGCEDFVPDSFKKTKCSNCFHVHAGAPPPPAAKAAAKPEEPAAEAVPKCKDCACTNFKPDAFKKSKCSNCFHNHV